MRLRYFILAALLICIALSNVRAEETKLTGKISGYLMGDYYYMVGADTAAKRGNRQYSATPKDFQAFQFRRLYVIYDQPLSDKFAFQTIIESNDKTYDPTGKFGLYVKTAFLEWKEIIGTSTLRIGLIPTLTWGYAEKMWNYRSLEKTIADANGLGQPTDMGVSLRGMIDNEGMFSYGAMISNGTASLVENNKYKKYSGEVLAKPLKELSIEVVADYEPGALDKSKTTLKGLVAYQNEHFTIGGEYVQQTQANAAGVDTSIVPQGLSFFAWAPIPGVENLNGIVRYDMFDPNTKSSTAGFKENFLEIGVDYMPIPNVHFMPNLWMNTYSSKASATRSSDVVARLTFFYIYK